MKHEWKNVKWYTIYIHAVSLSVPKSTRRFGYMSVLHFRAQLPESPSSLVLWPPALMLRWAHGCIILSVEDGKVTCPHGECSRWSLFRCQGFFKHLAWRCELMDMMVFQFLLLPTLIAWWLEHQNFRPLQPTPNWPKNVTPQSINEPVPQTAMNSKTFPVIRQQSESWSFQWLLVFASRFTPSKPRVCLPKHAIWRSWEAILPKMS